MRCTDAPRREASEKRREGIEMFFVDYTTAPTAHYSRLPGVGPLALKGGSCSPPRSTGTAAPSPARHASSGRQSGRQYTFISPILDSAWQRQLR